MTIIHRRLDVKESLDQLAADFDSELPEELRGVMVRGTLVPLPFKRERRYIMKYGTKNKVHERRAAFLFILPAVVLLAAFLILPAVFHGPLCIY